MQHALDDQCERTDVFHELFDVARAVRRHVAVRLHIDGEAATVGLLVLWWHDSALEYVVERPCMASGGERYRTPHIQAQLSGMGWLLPSA